MTEDPALLIADLDEDERTYFLGQRARIEGAVAAATGYAIERRAEGSALVVGDRAFTDIPFPTNAAVKQVALLLCDRLAEAGSGGELSREALRVLCQVWWPSTADTGDAIAMTLRRSQRSPPRRSTCCSTCGLASLSSSGSIVPSALAARFRSPTVRTAGAQR